MDYEGLLPFPILALLLWPAGIVTNTFGLLVTGAIIVAFGQFMVLTRTMSRPAKERMRYVLLNEVGLVCSIFVVLGLQLALH